MILCKDCKFYETASSPGTGIHGTSAWNDYKVCDAPENKKTISDNERTWQERLDVPEMINKDNNCKWFIKGRPSLLTLYKDYNPISGLLVCSIPFLILGFIIFILLLFPVFLWFVTKLF